MFENKLKPGTAPAIATLRAAHIPTRMVTGDNVRTAISVGRECGIIQPMARIFLPTFLKGEFSFPLASAIADLSALPKVTRLPLVRRLNGAMLRMRVAS